MASLKQIRQAIADTVVAGIPTLNPYPNVPGSPNLPALVVVPRADDMAAAFGGGLDVYQFDLLILVSRADDGIAQGDLDDYVTGSGASSVRQVIFANRSLGLTDTDAQVTGMSQYGGKWDIGGVDHIGAALACTVHTSKS